MAYTIAQFAPEMRERIQELTSIEWSAPNVIVLAVGVLLALFVGCVAIVRTATPPPCHRLASSQAPCTRTHRP